MSDELIERVASLTQTDIDALWQACQIEISFGGGRKLRAAAQLRLQRLNEAGLVKHLEMGGNPTLAAIDLPAEREAAARAALEAAATVAPSKTPADDCETVGQWTRRTLREAIRAIDPAAFRGDDNAMATD